MIQPGRFIGFFMDLVFNRVSNTCTGLSVGASVIFVFIYSAANAEITRSSSSLSILKLKCEQVLDAGHRSNCPGSGSAEIYFNSLNALYSSSVLAMANEYSLMDASHA